MANDDGQIEAGSVRDVLEVRSWLGDLRNCLMFLTRLAIPQRPGSRAVPLSHTVRGFPLAGAVIGALSGLVLMSALSLGLSALVAASLAVLAAAAVTGGLHEDGLADVADGFGGGSSLQHKLDIMRDSRIGAFGVLALIFAVLLKVATLASLASALGSIWQGPAILIATGAVSRSVMAHMMHSVPAARSDGRAAEAGKPSRHSIYQTLGAAAAIGVPVLWLSCGPAAALMAILTAVGAYVTVKRITIRQIGGQTGDVLGASQLLAEIAMLTVLAATLNTSV